MIILNDENDHIKIFKTSLSNSNNKYSNFNNTTQIYSARVILQRLFFIFSNIENFYSDSNMNVTLNSILIQ